MFSYITVFGEKTTNDQIFKNASHTIVARKDTIKFNRILEEMSC